jgi:outer membrane protein assembly complex protein YaeT
MGWIYSADSAWAIPLAALDVSKEWRVEKIIVTGNSLYSEDELRSEMLTRERPWYRPWVERPVFDPVTFEEDLERLRRYYEARGYYDTEIHHDLTENDAGFLLTVNVTVKEGSAVVVSEIHVEVIGDLPEESRPVLPETLPIKRDTVFEETQYLQAERVLREVFLRQGYAHTESTRKAEVDVNERRVRVWYQITPGPTTVFGDTEIRGMTTVEPGIIRREIAYKPGDPFSVEKISTTRARLLALDLFASVRIAPQQTAGKPQVVPMEIEVSESPLREIKIGVGYSTEEEFRTQAEWRHLNWLGDGRQLSVQAKYSSINVSGGAELIQPHFITPMTKGVLSFKYEREDEETFLRRFTRLNPRIDHRFSAELTGFIGYRLEFDDLSEIDAATERALGDIRREGILSGPAMGLVWNTTDSPFYPTKGQILSLTVEQAGVIWGGAYRFFKITGEAKKYYQLGWDTVFASRLKLGLGNAIGADDRYPLFERFYAGGEKSVRGYGRRRLGPLSDSDDPLGGLSLLEGSLELRRPIWRELGGAIFIDFGQVALQTFDSRIFNLNFSSGFGLSYNTPVGPIRLDVGFPFQKPPNDRPWQIHFSIGAYF